MNAFRNAVVNRNNLTVTENGMVTNKSSLDPVVDLFFTIGASRGKDITNKFQEAFDNDPALTTRVALWARDAREGAGERKLFRDYLLFLEKNGRVDILRNILPLVPELGRWDDLLIFNTPSMKYLAYTLIAQALNEGNGLCAKWMPRKGSIAVELTRTFNLTPRQYRKMLVALTNVVETKMCAKDWNSIEFGKIPSLAASRYAKAFNRNAPAAYLAYKNRLVKGTDKVNAGAVYPYDVIKAMRADYRRENDAVFEAQWEALPNYVTEGELILPVVDVSGSMGTPIGNNPNLTAMDISISLGLYLAHKQTGPFGNMFVTFSQRPEFQILKSSSLRKNLEQLERSHWDMNTNLNLVFRQILNMAVRESVPAKDMPKMILIISDMEFDRCADLSAMEMIESEYKKAGYNVPRVVFWNVNARGANVPVRFNKEGVALISGFSPSILKSVLAAKSFTPRDIMLETVGIERYDF